MGNKKTGWPILEGFICDETGETHVFTDYRWNNGSIVRRWEIDPDQIDHSRLVTRPFSLGQPKDTDQ